MYAGGAEHPHREACRAVMSRIADGTLEAVTSAEVVQEILHRFSKGRREIGSRMARSVLDLFGEVLSVERQTVASAVTRYETNPQLSARDALHVATCVAHGIVDIVSVDKGFDVAKEIRRVDPRMLIKA